jgi:hypothetical protein
VIGPACARILGAAQLSHAVKLLHAVEVSALSDRVPRGVRKFGLHGDAAPGVRRA